MAERMPLWMAKHPCAECGTGYGQCAQGLVFSLKCCASCDHPTRWQPEPWTPADLDEMGIRRYH